MKAILMSIQPKWCELIASGKKTIEVRKTKPKLEVPFKVYIYCTQGKFKDLGVIGNTIYQKRMKVIGEFVCDRVDRIEFFAIPQDSIWIDRFNTDTCLTDRETYEYTKGKCFYEWHISDLVIYDEPKMLNEFKPYSRTEDDCKFSHLGYAIPRCKDCHECYVKRPPQSWCYVEGGERV